MSNWTMSSICDSIFCDILSETWSPAVWFYVADAAYVWCKILCFQCVKVKSNIRMGITIFKIFILGGIVDTVGNNFLHL